jgi:methylenetetrahydrofolate reductase (NADPH)
MPTTAKIAGFNIMVPEFTTEAVPYKKVALGLNVLADGSRVALANHSMEQTIKITGLILTNSSLSEKNFTLIPHIAAVRIKTAQDLAQLMVHNPDFGKLNEFFFIRGDGNPSGEYQSSLDLLSALPVINWERALVGATPISKVGIAGYPEKHPFISNVDLWRAYERKLELAQATGVDLYMVTQICFDPQKIAYLAERVRIPVMVGIPGPCTLSQLRQKIELCGIGNSARFLKSQRQLVLQIGVEALLMGRYDPTKLANRIWKNPAKPDSIKGFHISMFGDTQSTENWKKSFLKASHKLSSKE